MSIDTIIVVFFVMLIGLCLGSFLNVAALRGLSGESIVFPPSKCPKCEKKLNWYTNLPVISYIFLGGKCQFCRKPISPQYPTVEALNSILYVVMFLNFGLTLKTLFLCALMSLFILICITDFREHVVLDIHTYIMMGLGVLYNILHLGSITVIESFLGLAAGYLIFEIMAKFGTLTVKTRAFGEGDTLIAMGLGAFFGWKMLLVIVFLSVFVQALFALPALFIKHVKSKEYTNAVALFLVTLSIIGLKFLNPDSGSYFIYLAIVLTVLSWCLFTIIKSLKNKSDTHCFYYMPFGPALVFSAFIMLFYSKQILGFFI